MLRKNVEDERSSINDTRIKLLFQIALLGWREFVIEDYEVKPQLFLQITQLLRSSFSHIGQGIKVGKPLDHRTNGCCASSIGKGTQFIQRVLSTPHRISILGINSDQVRTLRTPLSFSIDKVI